MKKLLLLTFLFMKTSAMLCMEEDTPTPNHIEKKYVNLIKQQFPTISYLYYKVPDEPFRSCDNALTFLKETAEKEKNEILKIHMENHPHHDNLEKFFAYVLNNELFDPEFIEELYFQQPSVESKLATAIMIDVTLKCFQEGLFEETKK